uniref:VASt domain-containing protein n=1 Tax=Panagrolaimus davidi TaxID=227884 RepID=A0A914PGJ8_9BILA
MTASDTSSEGSDENSYNSTHSNVPATNTDIPTTIEPVIPVECQCREHKGRKLLDIEIPLSVEQTFKLLFTDNEWLNKFEISLKRSENKCTTWNEEENTGKKERVCIYTMELDNTFGPKSTKITETQICNPITSYSEGYTIIKEAINEGVPYCDSFSVECIYCVTKVSETKSRLKVHGGITFKKYIFGLIKGVIERSAITGLDSYYNALNQKLKTDEEHLLSFITVMDLEDIPIIADETPNENGITASTHSDAQLLTSNNRFADRVVSMSNLKESSVLPTAAAASENSDMPQTNEAKTVILLLKIIAVLLFLIFISNIWFNILSNRQQPQTIPSVPSASSLEELSELRKMVVSLESKFNTFLTGAKKEL